MVHLSSDFFTSLRPTKKFPTVLDQGDQVQPVTALDFDSTGEFLVAASEGGDSIQVFGCEGGEAGRVVYSKKYGVGRIKFAHRSSTVLYTSTKTKDDHAIRYLSLHDNKYLRYFTGHTTKVTQLLLSPLNDTFISVAPEESLCMWDLRTPHMQGRLNFQGADTGAALAAFDPQGLIFAVATGSKYLRLYDARNWERGAFTTFELTNPESSSGSTGTWSNLQFSPDGKEILIGTSSSSLNNPSTSAFLLDSFDGNVKGTLELSLNSNPNVLVNCLQYTPDSKFIIGGRSDGQIDVWNTTDNKITNGSNSNLNVSRPIVDTIEGVSKDPIRALAFNPKLAMLATVGDGTVFYI